MCYYLAGLNVSSVIYTPGPKVLNRSFGQYTINIIFAEKVCPQFLLTSEEIVAPRRIDDVTLSSGQFSVLSSQFGQPEKNN